MKNHNRLYNLLAAGSLTVLLLLTFLLFRSNSFSDVADAATTTVVEPVAAPASDLGTSQVGSPTQGTVDPKVAALETQNQQLLDAVKVLQARETQYQAELNKASQAMQQLATQAAQAPAFAYSEHEAGEHEYGEHEASEHEHGEHEAGEYGDDD